MSIPDKKKGILLALSGILIITPDSLFIRLSNIQSWDLVFYRGLIPFIILLIFLVIYYNKNFFKALFAIGIAGVMNAIVVALTNITFVISLDNTFVATGHFRHGILLAPGTAWAISEMLIKGITPDIVKPFGLEKHKVF